MASFVIDRYHPRLRRELQSAVDAGHIQQCRELALLEPEQLRPLALLSLQLLVIGIFSCVALDLVSYFWQAHVLFKGITWGGVAWHQYHWVFDYLAYSRSNSRPDNPFLGW